MKDLIYRQAAINAIENTDCELSASAWDELTNAIMQVPSAEQWIPVTERLPKEEKETYWVCTDAGTQCECRWTNINHIWTDLTTNWHWHICDYPKYTKVVAWMELPEPYEGGDADAEE